MTYHLESLGARNFEHMGTALATHSLEINLSSFGDGADGGREATWNGSAKALRGSQKWDGYGVVQAKFHMHPESVAKNLAWLKKQLKTELDEWARPGSRRKIKPDFFLFVSNVRLAAASGKDSIRAYVQSQIDLHALPIKAFEIWDADDLRILLDNAHDVRRRYRAFLTSGDIIAELLERKDWDDKAITDSILSFTARTFKEDNFLNLTQAGTVRDQGVAVADVFVDLPFDSPSEDGPAFGDSADARFEESGICANLIRKFNEISTDEQSEANSRSRKAVLVGGPGQGKSTATQWLTQTYRAAFLRDTILANEIELKAHLVKLESRSIELDLPKINARRWPFRLILTDLADYLAANGDHSLLHYIAKVISSRSSTTLAPADLRRWLGGYPWLLLIDGLDEVPNSSNRLQVMQAISDFFLDVAILEADVAAVATTRPQGYGEEFSPASYRHFSLRPLEVEEALEYAKGLVAVRNGAGTVATDRVMQRLTRASREDFTSRLFESPLQVTILTVLLEKLGRAPRDRWRLFSEYYKVISQREQEKGGDLAELLQTYETDVNHIHREIGHLLQQRSSESGGTSASIERSEFIEIISRRLEEQGHSEKEVGRLSDKFSTLVTERLVFLALLTSDRVGFELRSLQEFMAGEFIVNRPEGRVVDEIRARFLSPFWRNAVLFAIGSIFANREYLRAEIPLLCSDLNAIDSVSAVLRPGSDLALDILRDGSCHAHPTYARSLAKTSCEMLLGAPTPRARLLADIREGEAGRVILEEVQSRTSASNSVWLNRALALDAFARGNNVQAAESLTRIFADANANFSVNPNLVESLVALTCEYPSKRLRRNAGKLIGKLSPLLVARQASESFSVRGQDQTISETTPDWFDHLMSLSGTPLIGSEVLFEGSPTSLHLNPVRLDSEREAWAWVSKTEYSHPEWETLRAFARFAQNPAETSLGEALLAASAARSDWLEVRRLPWVLAVCLDDAQQFADHLSGGDEVWRNRLEELAAMARQGALGNAEIWETAQDRWASAPSFDSSQSLETEFIEPWAAPLWAGLTNSGLVLGKAGLAMSWSNDQNQMERTSAFLCQIARSSTEMGFGAQRKNLEFLGSFLAGLMSRNIEGLSTIAGTGFWDSAEQSAEVFGWLSNVDWSVGHGHAWIDWLAVGEKLGIPLDYELVENLGKARTIVGGGQKDYGQSVLDMAKDKEPSWPAIRFILHASPKLGRELSPHGLSSSEAPMYQQVERACRLISTAPALIMNGDCDEDIRAFEPKGSLGDDWLTLFIYKVADEQAICLGARAAKVFEEIEPIRAKVYLSCVENITSKSGPVGALGPF